MPYLVAQLQSQPWISYSSFKDLARVAQENCRTNQTEEMFFYTMFIANVHAHILLHSCLLLHNFVFEVSYSPANQPVDQSVQIQ